MNLAEFREAVYDRVGVDTDDALVTVPVVNRMVNAALQQIAVMRDWPWLRTSRTLSTAIGTGAYAPAADWRKTRQLRIDGSEEMTEYGQLELDSLWPLSTTRGEPTGFAIDGEQILLRPIPDAVYSVVDSYVKKEPILASDTDAPVMPYEFHDAVVEKAASLVFRRTGESTKAALAEAAFGEWMKLMPAQDTRSKGPRRIRVRPGNII